MVLIHPFPPVQGTSAHDYSGLCDSNHETCRAKEDWQSQSPQETRLGQALKQPCCSSLCDRLHVISEIPHRDPGLAVGTVDAQARLSVPSSATKRTGNELLRPNATTWDGKLQIVLTKSPEQLLVPVPLRLPEFSRHQSRASRCATLRSYFGCATTSPQALSDFDRGRSCLLSTRTLNDTSHQVSTRTGPSIKVKSLMTLKEPSGLLLAAFGHVPCKRSNLPS